MYHAILSVKKQKERRRKRIARSVLFLVCAAILSFLIVQFFRLPSFQIKKITVEGNKIIEGEKLKSIAQKDISGKYLFLFPKSHIFLYPGEMIQNEIYAAFPRASSVNVSLKDGALVLSVKERNPAALWCGKEKNILADDKCFYIDDTGYVFGESPVFSGSAYFKFYGQGMLKEGTPVGHVYISPSLFQKIFELRRMIEKYERKMIDLLLLDESRAEFTADSGCKIIFNTDQDFSSLRANMEAVFKSADWGKKLSGADKCADLEYIDFRFGNKIYYKQKGLEPLPMNGTLDPNEKTVLLENNAATTTAN